MIEAEIKAKIDEGILEKFKELGLEKLKESKQSDTYYDHPCRKFMDTDESVRVRDREESGLAFYYKSPKVDSQTKSRQEYKTPVNSDIYKILKKIGFTEFWTVKKKRSYYSLDDVKITYDEVEGLGTYLELEVAADEDTMEEAKAQLFSVLEKLGIPKSALTRKSYVELLYEKSNGASKK